MLNFVAAVWLAAQPRGDTITSIRTKLYEANMVHLHRHRDFIMPGEYSAETGELTGEFGSLLTGVVTNDIFRKHLLVDNGYIYPIQYPHGNGLTTEEMDSLEEACGKWT